MAVKMERPRDVVGGLVLVAIGVGFLVVGRELEFGTARNMGPGYFPTVLSGIVIALGAAMAVLAWRAPHEEGAFGHVPWPGVILVIGAVAFFGLALRGLGLATVLVLLVLAVASASRYATVISSALLAVGMAVFCVLLFIQLLGLPLPLVGPWLSPSYWSTPAGAPPGEQAAPPQPAQ